MANLKAQALKMTKANLEACGWLFSSDLGIMVREHELSDNSWDIEVDSYVPVAKDFLNVIKPGTWEPDSNAGTDSYDTFEQMMADHPGFARVLWTHGDNVEML